MKLAYLLNTYPITSTTFIRREIAAHEAAGHPVLRYAIRPWDTALVDPEDIAEAGRTFYLLRNPARLFAAALREAVTNPRGLIRALGATARLMRAAPGRGALQLVYLVEAIRLKQETVRQQVDHLHTHFSTNSASVALLAHLLGGPRFSMTVHGPDELFEMSANALALKADQATFVAAISDYCRWAIDSHTGGAHAGKLHVVRCGLDLEAFDAGGGVPEDGDLVCVGRLTRAKSQGLLIEALARVVPRHPGLRLVLIGDGDDRAAIEARVAELELGDHVVLAGWASGAEVRAALLRARALVLPSLAEGLPIVIMESFALGRPVLTTDAFGMPELVDASCGWLARPGDVDSLVDCLDDLMTRTPEALVAMGRIGRARVEAMHDQTASARRLRELMGIEG